MSRAYPHKPACGRQQRRRADHQVALDVPGLKEEYYAEIIGADATLDLAVLRIIDAEEDTLFPYLELGDSDAARQASG